jgi:AraC-like DNA-binding protein
MRHLNRIAPSLIFLLAVGMNAYAQSNEQNITVTVKPSQTVEERVADSIKEKELREAAEDKLAAEKSARIAAKSPRALLSRARTVFVSSNTSYFKPIQLQNALRKRSEFEVWEMAIIDGWDKHNIADMIIEVDRPLFTFTFTYKITERSTGILLTSGKITAFDGNAAAPLLAERIVEDVKEARGEATNKK